MKFACLAVVCALTAVPAMARDLMAEAEVDGTAVLIYGDGFWRFSDTAGEVCTAVQNVGEICALPSMWAPTPAFDPAVFRPKFIADTGFVSEVNSLTPLSLDRPINSEDATAFILNRTTAGGLRGMVLRRAPGEIGGLAGETVMIGAGAHVAAFTAVNQNGRAIIAETWQYGTTLVHGELVEAHASFLTAIALEPFE